MKNFISVAAVSSWAWAALILQAAVPTASFMPPKHHAKSLTVYTEGKLKALSPSPVLRLPTSSQYRAMTALPLAAPSAAAALAVAAFPPLGSVLVLALIVLVHEAGHYLAAKSFGITVEEFSVGVGPKLFGFEAGGDEFNVRALPLGGYVRFPENYNATLVRDLEIARMNSERKSKEIKQLQQSTSLADSPSFMKQTINFLTLGQAEQQRRKQQEEEQKRLQDELEQNNLPFWRRSFFNPSATSPITTKRSSSTKRAKTTASKSDEIEYYDDPNLLQNRPWTQRAAVLSMGVIFNLILSYSLCFGEIKWSANGLPQAVFEPGAVVSSIRSDSTSRGLLQPGDVIVGINGKLADILTMLQKRSFIVS